MGKGSQTTSSTSAPNPQAMQAYQDLLTRAGGVASTPYQAYSGEQVAPFNSQQNTGVSNINTNWNYAQPFIQTAQGLAMAGASPITSADISQYMSPYTQNVVNTTQAQFNNQNQQQLQNVKGNAITQGALGGNREAIAEAELANQQNLAQAPVIAGLENQGYTTGLNTALTEQQAKAAGAYSLGNLGVAGQGAALTGAAAQLGAGTQQQQTQQAQDAAAYQQFLNQLAFPYQQTQWLAGLDSGIGSQMGGTSSTTGPSPSMLGQLLGAGTSAAGILGGTGAFGSAGWLTALLSTGGAVGRARGGVAPEEPETVPEPHETLVAQQHQLIDGHRRVQMFPRGTRELMLPHGVSRIVVDGDVFHYDPNKISAEQIKHTVAQGRENELLDLGQFSKHEIMHRLRGGEIPVAVVERRPDGTEVRAAAGTHTTVQHQMAMMHRTKSPGNTLHFEDPRHTLAHRISRSGGGYVPGFDTGGGVAGLDMAGTPYTGGRSFIPGMNITRGQGAPRAPGIANQQSSNPAQMGQQVGALAKTIMGGFNSPMNISPDAQGAFSPSPVGTNFPIGTAPSPEAYSPSPTGSPIYRRGGAVGRYAGGVANLPMHNRIMMPHGYADGGMPDIPFDPTAGGIAPAYDPFGDNAPTQFNVDPSVGDLARNVYLNSGAPMPEPVLAKGDRGAAPPSGFDQGIAPSFADRAAGEFDTSSFAPSPAAPPTLADQGVSNANVPLDTLTSPGFGGSASAPITGMEAIPAARATDISTPTAGYADNMDRIAAAHRQIESGGNYGAVGPANPKNGDHAYGAYQVMGENIPTWTKQYLGRSMTPQEFLHDPAAQDAVYKARMGQYIGQYGLNGALDHWLGMGKTDFTGTTHPQYQQMFMAALNGHGAPNGVAGDNSILPAGTTLAQSTPENRGVAPPQHGIDWSENSKLWPALMSAGFGMMASGSPFPGVAIGQGGQQGLQTYAAEKAQEMKQHQIDLEATRLSQQADLAQKKLALETLPYKAA